MKVRIVCCDDSEEELKRISEYLQRLMVKKDFDFDVKCYLDGESVIEGYHNEPENFCDILLLDVEMDTMNGLEIAKTVRGMGHTV